MKQYLAKIGKTKKKEEAGKRRGRRKRKSKCEGNEEMRRRGKKDKIISLKGAKEHLLYFVFSEDLHLCN